MEKRNPLALWWENTMENSMEIPLKTRNKNTYNPAIPIVGIYPEKTMTQKDICTPTSIAAPFTVARTWKQPRCPSADEWVRKLGYIYTMKFYSVIKKHTHRHI